jgi:hypothetical protein
MSRIVIVMLTYHRHKLIDIINLLRSYRKSDMFPVRYGQTYRVGRVLNRRQGDG